MEEALGPRRAVRISLALATIAMLVAAGCGGDSGSSKIAEEAGCENVSAPEPKDVTLPAPKQTVQPGEELTAVVKTSCGTFEIALDTKAAPKTTNSFAYLAREGFYDGLDFNRIVPGLIVQGGDPAGDGTGSAGYTIAEPPPADTKYTKGVVAMAREFEEPSGQSGSQFFVEPVEILVAPAFERTLRIFANEQAARSGDESGLGDDAGRVFALRCECGTHGCAASVHVPAGEYRAIRAHDRRYFVRHRHELPDDERVLITNAGYSVVEQR